MIWLYWRRVRLTVLVVAVATGAMAALVVGVAFLAGAGRGRDAEPGDGQVGVDWQAGGGHQALEADTVDDRRGLRLMQGAAAACQTVSYHGDQLVAWSGPGGTSTYFVKVWHRRGSTEQADGDDDDGAVGPGDGGQRASARAVTSGGHAVAGVLSVSPWMIALMRSNYVLAYSGTGSVIGRSADVVTLRRRGGGLAARYWLDQTTGLPLRRQVFDASGRQVNEGAFTDLTIGSAELDNPPPSAVAWSSRPAMIALASLRKQGWLVPAALADDLALVSLAKSSTRSGAVVDASYSDGLSVVSVFMQRGELPSALPGWHRADVSGLAVLSSEPDERSLAWSAQGVVYTVIADAPQETVDGVVAGLPHDHGIGFWQRVGRGLGRMGSWFDPFG